MATVICSGFSPRGLEQYGRRFLETAVAYWPRDVAWRVYTEEPCRVAMPEAIRSLWDCAGIREFIDRYSREPRACGRDPSGLPWKDGDRRRGYSFRFDAVKFSRQCVIPLQASLGLADGDVLAWMDADVVTHRSPPQGFVPSLLGGADGCYLGRGRKHSEIGFWAVRLSPATRCFLKMIADAYISRTVFGLKEWHSAYVWDRCREAAEAAGVKFRDLTPGGSGHVWHQSPLAAYTDHLKGNRKALGRSPERRGA